MSFLALLVPVLLTGTVVAQQVTLSVLEVNALPADKALQKQLGDELHHLVSRYPRFKVGPKPKLSLAALMLSLGCLEIDAACLAGVGRELKVEQLLYAEVQLREGIYTLRLRLVDVVGQKFIKPTEIQRTRKKGDLAPVLRLAVKSTLGPPPLAPVQLVPISIKTTPAGAKVFLNQELAGASPLRRKVRAGTYVVRMEMTGYQPLVREVRVTPNVPLDLVETLEAIPVAETRPTTPVATRPETMARPPEKPYYKKWWFWTAIGGGVLAVTLTAVLVPRALGGEEERGTLNITIDPANANSDVTFR